MKPIKFLKNMYGDRPIRWHDKLQGYERLPDYHQLFDSDKILRRCWQFKTRCKEGLNAAPEVVSLGTSLRTFQKLQLYSLDIGLHSMEKLANQRYTPSILVMFGVER